VHSATSHSFPVLLALALAFAMRAPAQQTVCMSLHGVPATGTNNLGQPSQVAARVEGVQVAVPAAAGATPAQTSAAHEAAFAAAGFTTVRVNATEFCVTAGPGGAPITRGLCYGTDEPSYDLDSSVARAVPPPGGNPAGKDNGAVVPLPPVQQPPLPFGGVVTIYIYVRVGPVRLRICIQISLMPSLPGSVLQQQIRQQLAAQGFHGSIIQVRDPLAPTRLIDVLQLERTTAGDPIDGVEYVYDAMSRRIVRSIAGAGLEPEFGASEYGTPTQGLAPRAPWSSSPGLPPRIDSFFDVFHHVELPLRPGGIAINLVPSAVPVLNGMLLVDPTGMVFEFGFSDANGTFARHWVVPNDQTLVGLPLCSQGVAFEGGQLVMTTGMRAVIGR
jgi:hypothetical protein